MQTTLKTARLKRGWTLQQLADASGVAVSSISRLERGETSPMHATAKALEDALQLKRGSLVFTQLEAAS